MFEVHAKHRCTRRSRQTSITRHNRVRNLLNRICIEAVMEKKGILGDSDKPGRRPGDVSMALWSKGRDLAIDVAVTCPFTINNVSRSEPCEYYAESKKHAY